MLRQTSHAARYVPPERTIAEMCTERNPNILNIIDLLHAPVEEVIFPFPKSACRECLQVPFDTASHHRDALCVELRSGLGHLVEERRRTLAPDAAGTVHHHLAQPSPGRVMKVRLCCGILGAIFGLVTGVFSRTALRLC